jgi:DNA-binding GntR family transcriptional regulator
MTDLAYRSIKSRIIELDLAPGEFFTESRLATEFGFSKTPVREALARLRREGLVNVAPRAGYTVASITVKDAKNLFALRLLLEQEAAALAASQLTDASELVDLEARCRAARPSSRAEVRAFLKAVRDFHLAIARASGNPRLEAVLDDLLLESERLVFMGLTFNDSAALLIHEHDELLNAIASRDPSKARRVAANHVRDAEKMVIEALLLSSSVLEAKVAAAPWER